jgi:hypothetical protein
MIQVQQEIPSQYAGLFAEYVASLQEKLDTIMWIVLDNGHKIMMVEKEKHQAMIEKLLRSGDERRVRVAEEVMRRSLGSWR